MSKQLFTRKQLYELVWSKPMTQLAKEFGLSDNGLRKICKKYDIPLPNMGHWQKLEYGKKTVQEELGNFDKWLNIKFIINESEADDQEHYLTKFAKRVKEIGQDCNKLLPVPEKLINPHPMVKAASDNLNNQKKSTSWRNLPECIHTNRGLLSISVQKHNVPRALRIMDVLIKMAEYRGHEVGNDQEATQLIVYGEKFNIRFREKHTRHQISNDRWPTTETVPNDILSIKYVYFMAKEWDDKGSLLEGKLPKILAFFELKSIEIKEQRQRNRIAQEESERKREIERKHQAQREWESKKHNLLINYSQEWRKAEHLRQFILKIEKSNDNSDKVNAWLEWSKLQLIDLDPLSEGVETFINQFDTPETLKD